jgi:hypothetical protein
MAERGTLCRSHPELRERWPVDRAAHGQPSWGPIAGGTLVGWGNFQTETANACVVQASIDRRGRGAFVREPLATHSGAGADQLPALPHAKANEERLNDEFLAS